MGGSLGGVEVTRAHQAHDVDGVGHEQDRLHREHVGAFAQLGELAVGGQPGEEGVGGRPHHPHEHLELVARRPGHVEELGRHRDPGIGVLGPEHHVVHEGEGAGEGGGVVEGAHVVDRGERVVDRADAGGGALGGPAQPEHRGQRRGLGRVVADEQLERAVDHRVVGASLLAAAVLAHPHAAEPDRSARRT